MYKLTPLSLLGLTLAGLHDNARCKMTGQSSGESLCNTSRVRLRRIRCPGRRVGGVGHGGGGKLKGRESVYAGVTMGIRREVYRCGSSIFVQRGRI